MPLSWMQLLRGIFPRTRRSNSEREHVINPPLVSSTFTNKLQREQRLTLSQRTVPDRTRFSTSSALWEISPTLSTLPTTFVPVPLKPLLSRREVRPSPSPLKRTERYTRTTRRGRDALLFRGKLSTTYAKRFHADSCGSKRRYEKQCVYREQ